MANALPFSSLLFTNKEGYYSNNYTKTSSAVRKCQGHTDQKNNVKVTATKDKVTVIRLCQCHSSQRQYPYHKSQPSS